MENTTKNTTYQDVTAKKSTHIRIPVNLYKRLRKIKNDTGKMQDTVNKEIIELGIKTYYSKNN